MIERAAAAIAALVLAPSAAADALQDRLVAAMRATDTGDVGFTQTTEAAQTGGKRRVIVTRYDPRAAPTERWSVTSIDGRAPTAKERAGAIKAAKGTPIPAYARLARWFGAPATRVASGPGTVTYRFASLPAGIVKMGSHDASAETMAEAVVNVATARPYVERVRFTSHAGFRIMLVAKVERFTITAAYAPLADGRPFPTATDGDIAGSLMGKSGSIVTHSRYVVAR